MARSTCSHKTGPSSDVLCKKMDNPGDYMLEEGHIAAGSFGEDSRVHMDLYLNDEHGTPLAGLDVCEDSLQDLLVCAAGTTDVKIETKDICEDSLQDLLVCAADTTDVKIETKDICEGLDIFEAMTTREASPDSPQLSPEAHGTLAEFPNTTVNNMEKNEKQKLRALKNRYSAQQSRQRKKDYDVIQKARIERQDARIRELETKNLELQNEVFEKTQIKTLNTTIKELEQKKIELQNAVKAKDEELQLFTQKIEFVLSTCTSDGCNLHKRKRA